MWSLDWLFLILKLHNHKHFHIYKMWIRVCRERRKWKFLQNETTKCDEYLKGLNWDKWEPNQTKDFNEATVIHILRNQNDGWKFSKFIKLAWISIDDKRKYSNNIENEPWSTGLETKSFLKFCVTKNVKKKFACLSSSARSAWFFALN